MVITGILSLWSSCDEVELVFFVFCFVVVCLYLEGRAITIIVATIIVVVDNIDILMCIATNIAAIAIRNIYGQYCYHRPQ